MIQFSRRQFGGLLVAAAGSSRNLFGAVSLDDVLRSGRLKRGIPSMVAMTCDADRVRYAGGFGPLHSGSTATVGPDSIHQIASMTKPITSVAAMQLVERGKVKLDEPVGKFLPQLAHAQVLEGFNAAGQPIVRPARTAITLRHLLTHTSGISYPTWHEAMARYAASANIGPTSIAPVVPLMFEPGAGWQYGFGVDWAGRLVEAVSGMNLSQYFQQNILGPLGMQDTSFNVAPDKFDRLVDRYTRTPDGKFQVTPRVQPPQVNDFNGGGGLYSTAQDYVKFMQMILRHGMTGINTEILTARSVNMMMQNQIGTLTAGRLKTVQAPVSADVDTNPGGADQWGLGFLLQGQRRPGMRQSGSASWAGIFNTYFWIDPHLGMGGVILMQYLPFFDAEAIGLLGEFERAVYVTA